MKRFLFLSIGFGLAVGANSAYSANANQQLSIRLFDAARVDQVGLVEELIRKGANVNFQYPQKNNNTPLMVAANGGNIKVARVLLEHGANPSLKNKLGRTALWFAQNNKNQPMINLLMQDKEEPEGSASNELPSDINNKLQSVIDKVAPYTKSEARIESLKGLFAHQNWAQIKEIVREEGEKLYEHELLPGVFAGSLHKPEQIIQRDIFIEIEKIADLLQIIEKKGGQASQQDLAEIRGRLNNIDSLGTKLMPGEIEKAKREAKRKAEEAKRQRVAEAQREAQERAKKQAAFVESYTNKLDKWEDWYDVDDSIVELIDFVAPKLRDPKSREELLGLKREFKANRWDNIENILQRLIGKLQGFDQYAFRNVARYPMLESIFKNFLQIAKLKELAISKGLDTPEVRSPVKEKLKEILDIAVKL